MQSKISLSIILFGLILSSIFMFYSSDKTRIVSLNYENTNLNLPMRLKIPKINVDSIVESVGLTPEGAMDVPKERTDVAWFNLGTPPGKIGSAVIAGHYGWKNKESSAFDNLHKLQKGDRVYVEDDKGELITFIVVNTEKYNPTADTTKIFSSDDGKPHLNLITCSGTWNSTEQDYSTRLIVFTDMEEN